MGFGKSAFAHAQLRVGAPIVCPLVGILPFASSGPRPWRELNPHGSLGRCRPESMPPFAESLVPGPGIQICQP